MPTDSRCEGDQCSRVQCADGSGPPVDGCCGSCATNESTDNPGDAIEYYCALAPTVEPTEDPTVRPSAGPTVNPTVRPSARPTDIPTEEPTEEPTFLLLLPPEVTEIPSIAPTEEPAEVVTAQPTPPGAQCIDCTIPHYHYIFLVLLSIILKVSEITI